MRHLRHLCGNQRGGGGGKIPDNGEDLKEGFTNAGFCFAAMNKVGEVELIKLQQKCEDLIWNKYDNFNSHCTNILQTRRQDLQGKRRGRSEAMS
jgi:hypothetical protein